MEPRSSHLSFTSPPWLTWEWMVLLAITIVPFVTWGQDVLYGFGWLVAGPLLVLRFAAGQTIKLWSLLAIGLVAIAVSGHCWNRYALLYIGASLAMTLASKSRNVLPSPTNSRNSWLAAGCYGVGIWGGSLLNWTSPGFLELHCATWLVVLLHAISHCSSRSDWKPWTGMTIHLITCLAMNAWAPAMGLFIMAMWWVWGHKLSIRSVRLLAFVGMSIALVLVSTTNTWSSSIQSSSLRERSTLWSWTISQDLGLAHGPGKWRLDIAEADLFDGKRQPRRTHNDWLQWGYELGWMGLIVLVFFVVLHPWLALITAPLFFLWFPTERPDLMLALALVASGGRLGDIAPFELPSIKSYPKLVLWAPLFILGFGAVWVSSLAMAMHSIRVQRRVEMNIATHRTLPPLSDADRLSLEWFPEGVRGQFDGWMRLLQYALDEGKPCEAVHWAKKRHKRSFPAQVNLEMKAKMDCL